MSKELLNRPKTNPYYCYFEGVKCFVHSPGKNIAVENIKEGLKLIAELRKKDRSIDRME